MIKSKAKESSLAKPTHITIHSKTPVPHYIATVAPKTLSNIYRTKVIESYKNRQIFTIFGEFNTIRNSLLKRGWLEKLAPGRYSKLQKLPEEALLAQAKKGNEYEAVAISRVINHLPAFFVWQPKEHQDLYMDVSPYRNRIRIDHRMDFATKVGLIACAEQQHWFHQDGAAAMSYPRFFRLGPNQEERQSFIDEFRITQCYNLLRFLIKFFDRHEDITDYQNGTVCPTNVHFALVRVKQRADDWENHSLLDIDHSRVPEEEWLNFMDNSGKVIYKGQKIKCTYRELAEFVKTSNNLIAKTEEKRPDLKWDGYKNLWILKPGYMNRGRGIVIRNNLNEILQWCTTHLNGYYIVQKYIERPLLIYRTKFDIRQYMLICVREYIVQIWLYTDCYFRFSSQEYNTDDFNESIHLTNNCVQKKYKNKIDRDHRLPKNNMWTLNQFKTYLKTQNKADDFWEKHIFAGLRANLIAAVLPSFDDTNLIQNSFELFGCDFMLDEEYNPILIEINSTPDLSASTNITARICPMVQQDCVKVVVDLPRNNRASTGLFQLIYEVNYNFNCDSKNLNDLNVNGKSIELTQPQRPKATVKPKIAKKPLIKKVFAKKSN